MLDGRRHLVRGEAACDLDASGARSTAPSRTRAPKQALAPMTVRPLDTLDRRLCVAPMMDWTDRHCRYFHRLLSPAGAALHRDGHHRRRAAWRSRAALGFAPAEHPVALQLGGSDPAELAEAARIGAGLGYDEINLNCGCPSRPGAAGRFGACLMAEPERGGATAWRRCAAPCSVPVTVKCRIGIDDSEEHDFLDRFVATVAAAGLRHVRRARAQGLAAGPEPEGEPRGAAPALRASCIGSSAISRELRSCSTAASAPLRPPVSAPAVGRWRDDRPRGLREPVVADPAPRGADGRGASPDPARRGRGHGHLCRGTAGPRRAPAVDHPAHAGLFNGLPGARAWRRRLAAIEPADGIGLLRDAMALVTIPRDLAA